MNAQLNSTNFQQFVSENKGKKITFKHNDITVSKVVVDVCGDYFTAKVNESDAKIDGFYYFSECSFVEEKPALIKALEKNNVVVLHFTDGTSTMFKYERQLGIYIHGVFLSTSFPVACFNIDFIKEAWAVVKGNFKKIYPLEEEQNEKQEQSPMSSLSSYFETQNNVKNDKLYTAVKDVADEFIKVLNYFTTFGLETSSLIEQINKAKNNEQWTCHFFPTLFDVVNRQFQQSNLIKNNFTINPIFKAYLLRYVEILKEINIKNDRLDLVETNEDLIKRIKKLMMEVSIKEYETIFNRKYFHINKSTSTVPKQISIEYRGKPKTVEVVSEYTRDDNKKEYVLVKDLTDNNKTKTLFKEYIKYL